MNKEDIAFYESKLVMCVARNIGRKEYDTLSDRAKKIAIEQAVKIVQAILNDPFCMERIRLQSTTGNCSYNQRQGD